MHAVEMLASKFRDMETLPNSENDIRNAIGLFLVFVGCLSPQVLFRITPQDISLGAGQIEIRTSFQHPGRSNETHTMCFAQTNANPLCHMMRWLERLGLDPASPIWPANTEPELLKLLQENLPQNIGPGIHLEYLRYGGARCAANFTTPEKVMEWVNWTPGVEFRWRACDPPAEDSELHKTMVALFQP